MIELERHIEILLLSNDCVIVPNLGGFMAHHVDARYDEQENTFLPPLRTLGFNPQLKINDSLLVQSYIEAYDISYPEAQRRIEAEVAELRQHLEAEGSYELNDIGVLSLNDEGKMEFEPCEAGILTPQLYALDLFEMPLLNALAAPADEPVDAAATETNDTAVPSAENAIVIKMSWLRNIVAVAAAVLAFFMIGTPVNNSNGDMQQSTFLPIPQVVSSPSTTIETTAATTAEEPAQTAYCLVLASHVSEANAESFIQQLRKAGFTKAETMQTKSMRRVVYGSYPTEASAYNELRQLRSESRHFAEAWVMKR